MELFSVKKVFTQEGDCCNGETQLLTIFTEDGGGGPYLVIQTERWAFDEEGLEEFLSQLRSVLAEVERAQETSKE